VKKVPLCNDSIKRFQIFITSALNSVQQGLLRLTWVLLLHLLLCSCWSLVPSARKPWLIWAAAAWTRPACSALSQTGLLQLPSP
jgi:hypothetical protein